MNAADNLEAIRGHLQRDELTPARAKLDPVLTETPADPEASRLRDDLAGREARRDTTLHAARECMDKSLWDCALDNASRASAVDRTSDAARQIIEKITHLGLARRGSDPRSGPVPPSTSSPGASGHDPAGARDAASTGQSGCEAIVRAGREALQAKDYDRAITTADAALTALGLCPGAQRLKQEAIDAKTEARRREMRQ